MHQNIKIMFSHSLKIKLWLYLKKTLWVVRYSMLTQLRRSLCGHTTCWGFWGRPNPLGMQSCPIAPPRKGEMPRRVPGTAYSCWAASSPGACSVSVLEGEGRTYTCKHGLLLSWSCRAIHHQFDMCSAGYIYFSSWVWGTHSTATALC